MGAFVVNFHVRGGNSDTLVRELDDLQVRRSYVADDKQGWASVYEEQASTQDDAWIRQLGGELSRRTQQPAVAFLVHDSDFVCYWLFERGELVDEFNSFPDYFDDGSDGATAVETLRGRPDVLLRYCRRGVTLADVEAVLEQEPVFAEGQLESIADLLGIDPERALLDFRDFADGAGPDGADVSFVGAETPDDGLPALGGAAVAGRISLADLDENSRFDDLDQPDVDSPGDAAGGPGRLLGRSWQRLFGRSPAADHDPLTVQLVQAASEGDVAEIERLVHEGANVNATAPLKVDLDKHVPGLGRLAAGMMPALETFPLLAAVAKKQVAATQKLLELGADVNAVHPLFGTAVHTAVTAGAAELLRLLLDSTGRVNEKNAQGQTPLAALQAARQVKRQLQQLQSLGVPMPGNVGAQLEQMMPAAGWDECEQILRDAGGR